MFNKLDRKKAGFWTPQTIIVSLLLHVLLGAGFLAASQTMEARKKEEEKLVEFDIAEEQQKEEPKPEEPPPPPPPPEPEPDTPPPVAKGFQELVPPEVPPPTISPPDPAQTAVNVEDFSGVGKAGGVSQGVDNGVAQDVSDREAPPDEGTYEMSAVEELPQLSNAAEVRRQLSSNYPPLLRDAGVTGTVQIRMRVNEDGRVDPASVEVESASHDAFADAARRVAQRMRFRPAKVGGRAVKVMVTIPVTFQLEG